MSRFHCIVGFYGDTFITSGWSGCSNVVEVIGVLALVNAADGVSWLVCDALSKVSIMLQGLGEGCKCPNHLKH